MIQISGTDYEQPEDKAIVAYNGDKYCLISDGNVIQRLKVADVLESHNHEGDDLYPRRIYMDPAQSSFYIVADGNTYIRLNPTTYGSSALIQSWNTSIQGTFNLYLGNPTGSSSVTKIVGNAGYRTALADAWLIYPSSLALKSNVAQISQPLAKIREVRGITYEQEGVSRTGFTAEDLEKTNLPGATYRDKDGNLEGINPMVLVSALVESIKELEARIITLEREVRS